MPTCASTNVSSKPSTESCTPLISACFPRTADGAGVQSGSNACKSSIRRPYLSSPISFSKASVASEDREKEGRHQSSRQYSCQRVCALRHSFHLCGQEEFLHAPPLQLPQRRSTNAIKIQILVTLIANLLLMVLQKRIKRNWSFSNLATMVRIMLMYYIDCYSFFEHPEKDWLKILDTHENPPDKPSLFD